MNSESMPVRPTTPADHAETAPGKKPGMDLPTDEKGHEENMLRVYRVDSPEGAPFTPALEGSFLVVLMVVAVASVIVAGIVVGILFGWGMGLAVFGLGLVLAIGGNPEVWATILRVREHQRLEKRVNEQEQHNRSVSGSAFVE